MGRTNRQPDKRSLHLAGTPIFDGVVADLKFDPASMITEPAHATPATVAKRVRKSRATKVAA